MTESLQKLRQYLLTGVSYVIPCIACGGILIAAAIAFAPLTPEVGPQPEKVPILQLMLQIGVTAFKLALPILAGYISYAIAGKPGLVPGFIGGYLAGEVNAGFLGALVIGLLAGWIVNLIKTVPVPKYIKPIMPILIIPIVSSGIVGLLMLKVIGIPIANLMELLADWLRTMSTGNAALLAIILGGMIAFDMGGPVNKAAFFFGAAMIKEGQYAVMGACAAAICTPPLGLGLATLIRRKLWSDEEKEGGIAALAMGMIGITEGAIPFAAADPLRVIPCIMLGSMVAAVIAMIGGVGDHAPHGGPIVLPVVDNRIAYVFAIVVGTLVTALAIILLKTVTQRRAPEKAEVSA
ncbi:MAG: PTS fructose transporter subunit IIC [Phycisphaerae bacterium]|nr:PTS fructose transporter subunit IIC [Phycisphaerae bacterium]HQL55714.1 PTS fructose transporter subunit IIC [Phycisphaerae bacterium]